jgi:hypothetical protein
LAPIGSQQEGLANLTASMVSARGIRDSLSLYGLHKRDWGLSQPLWSPQEGLGTLSASMVSARGIRDSVSL